MVRSSRDLRRREAASREEAFRRLAFTTLVLATAVSFLMGFATKTSAEVIGTQEAFSTEARQVRIAEVQQLMGREEVARAMEKLGVDPADARLRVAALSDAELEELQGNLETAPAGGDVLVVLGILLIVLVVLDLTGAVRIFRR